MALGGIAVADAIKGGLNQKRGERLLQQAREIAERTGVAYTRAMIESMGGAFALLLGQWKKVHTFAERAENLFRKECTGVAWELDTIHNLSLWATAHMGDLAELRTRLPVLLQEAVPREAGSERAERYIALSERLASQSSVHASPRCARESERQQDEIQLSGLRTECVGQA
jgi:hypothetical protein